MERIVSLPRLPRLPCLPLHHLVLFVLLLFLGAGNNNNALGFEVKSVYVFGDSIFDAGNNHYIKSCGAQADYPPYGLNFFHHPTGRFTNGRIVPDFLSEFIGVNLQKPFQEAKLEFMNGTQKDYPSNGINFASAGSGVLSATNQHLNVTPLEEQLQQFRSLMAENQLSKKEVVKESLFLLESGSNDIFNYFNPLLTPLPPLSPSPEVYIGEMLKGVQDFVNQIYSLGARRIVLFSLGPVGCVPARVSLPGASIDQCFLKMNEMVRIFNLGLENIVISVPRNHPGAVATYAAVDHLFMQFKKHPIDYGFDDVNNACCGNGNLGGELQCGHEGYKICGKPNKFLFWDYFHPSEHTNKLVSKALWSGGPTSIRPVNLKTLTTKVHTS